MEHTFQIDLQWPGGRNVVGSLQGSELHTAISIPKEMDGPGIGTNPDELLLGAAATCYLISLAALLENATLPVKNLTMQAEGIVEVNNGVFTYKKIIHKPKIFIESSIEERQLKRIRRLAEKAEQTCMISKAIKGNVEIELNIKIEYV